VTVLAAAAASTSAWDQPGTLGFLVVFGMAVILYFVFRSMSRHLKKINAAAAAEAKGRAAAEVEDAKAGGAVTDVHADGSSVGPAMGNRSRSGTGSS
jgi:Na+-transporting methylmalonyl-CoA/oxaloacetate decarboxylase gamma subunit